MTARQRPGRRIRRLLAGSLAMAAVFVAPAAPAQVVVVAAAPESAAVGIAAGDVLVAWRPSGEAGAAWRPLESWLDPWRLDHLEMPRRGRLELEVRRGGNRRVIELPRRPLLLEVRPVLSAPVLASVEEILARREEPAEATVAALNTRLGSSGADAATWALARLAEGAAARGDLEVAATAYAAAVTAATAPLSAELRRRRGDILRRLGRFDDAEAEYRAALATWQGHERDGLGTSFPITALGSLEGARHRVAAAQRLGEEACAIRRRLAAGSWLVAGCLNNLGIVAGRRHDLALAEGLFAQALDLYRELGMLDGDGRSALSNLGIVARLRGDLERAESYHTEALAIDERRGDLRRIAQQRTNLANVVGDRGDDVRALALFDRVIDVDLPRSADAGPLSKALLNRARVHVRRGAPARATADLDRAQALLGFVRPDTPDAASIVQLRAEIALQAGDLARAAGHCAEALAAKARLQADSLEEALAASLCARIAAVRRQPKQAEELFRRSLTAVERQQRRVGGGERGLVAFRQKLQPLYREYGSFLLAAGRDADAFELYERSRAQALRALLAQRDLDLGDRIPGELAERRAALGAEIEGRYRELARLAEGAAGAAALRRTVDGLHAERDRIAAQIALSSPAAAALEAPAALSVAEIAAGLPRGTVVLAYEVGEKVGRVYVVSTAARVDAHELGIGAAELAQEVDAWRRLVASPRTSPALAARARRLSDLLLAPAADQLRGARRVLVVPDGPLHRLAFAALPPPAGLAEAGHLIELMAVVRDVSASVFVAAARDAPDVRSDQVVVFADPASSSAATSRFRRELGSLPASRREATALGELFGDRAEIFVGAAATETAARRALPTAGIAHFACHAVVDELLPLDSALVLAPGSAGGEGLLQAWEIAEGLRLDGSLVVLSACDTAGGGVRSGEGMVGLVRALQVAGARSVVASLWQVGDESTAELMRRFYRHLGSGRATDEALRRAQLELLRGPLTTEREGRVVKIDASAPRHWAPFVLLGSPR